jgi:hypothetical protein
MSHAPARGSGPASNERHHGLGFAAGKVELAQVLAGLLLCRAADLADENDALRLIVLQKDLRCGAVKC